MTDISWAFGGKTVLITGASRGIGLATANLFAAAGARVFGLSRSAKPDGPQAGVVAVCADVTKADELASAAAQAAEATGQLISALLTPAWC